MSAIQQTAEQHAGLKRIVNWFRNESDRQQVAPVSRGTAITRAERGLVLLA